MAKPKTMIKQGKKKKKEQSLEDADDYLAAGVEHEEAAGKWRAGDAAKSLRFFHRAIEVYQQGLTKYARNLDLAYNKARVELEIATHPVLTRQLDVPIRTVLEQALVSHRYALEIDPENPDTLFNTAQVLVTVAEELAKDDDRLNDTLKMLEEALELHARCLSVQEFRYEENEQQRREIFEEQEDGGVRLDQSTDDTATSSPSTTTAAAEDQWFSVVEPVTIETLIDTIIAQLSTLTTLTSILADTNPLPDSPTLPWISNFSDTLLNKLSTLTSSLPHTSATHSETQLARANLASTLLDASFRHSLIDLPTYKSQLTAAFTFPTSTPPSYDLLLAHATAILAYASTLADLLLTNPPPPDSNPPTPTPLPLERYTSLTTTTHLLLTASQLPSLPHPSLAHTHSLRGDISLLLFRLTQPSTPLYHPPAAKHAAQFLSNAETFYRNAAKLYLASTSATSPFSAAAGGESEEQEKAAVAGFRCTVAQVLQGKKAEMPVGVEGGGRRREWVGEQVGEMEGEGLVGEGFGMGRFGVGGG